VAHIGPYLHAWCSAAHARPRDREGFSLHVNKTSNTLRNLRDHERRRPGCRNERAIAGQADGAGRWLAGGVPAPHLDGCLDVDLESSAMTNALPVRRMGLAPGARAAAPAAYVRAVGLAGVEKRGWDSTSL
jgi:hypothetical protein